MHFNKICIPELFSSPCPEVTTNGFPLRLEAFPVHLLSKIQAIRYLSLYDSPQTPPIHSIYLRMCYVGAFHPPFLQYPHEATNTNHNLIHPLLLPQLPALHLDNT